MLDCPSGRSAVKPRRIGLMWWWYGVFFLLSLIVLCGPIWVCSECGGSGICTLPLPAPISGEYSRLSYRCNNCFGLGRVGLLRKGF